MEDEIDGFSVVHISEDSFNLLNNNLKKCKLLIQGYRYYKPIKSSSGGGQAEGILSCGHCGRIGAPMCFLCFKKLDKEIS